MKITYDTATDIVRILFNDRSIAESDEEHQNLIIDYDQDHNIVGIEILDATKNGIKPYGVDYRVIGLKEA